MPPQGSRAFTSLTAEDQWAMANGLSKPNSGSWKYNWNTNDIDNEFSTMPHYLQATLLQSMNAARQRIYSQQLQYDNNQKSKAAADAAKAAADAEKAAKKAANLSGGQASVPSVQQRMMSRMGQAVQKGVNKGKINSNQLGKYQVPGQQPTSPLANQLGNPEPNYQFYRPMPNKNVPDANGVATRIGYEQYRGDAGRDQYANAKTPVPMPNKLSTNELR
jgi:hypothetical protein